MSEDDILAALDFEIDDEPEVVAITDLPDRERQDLSRVIEAGKMLDVTQLDDVALSEFHGDVRQRLLATHQMHTPPERRTDEGKALHSAFIAIITETQRRRRSR